MAHYNPEVTTLIAALNDKVTPSFNIKMVTDEYGNNVTLMTGTNSELVGSQIEMQVCSICNLIFVCF